MAKVGKVGANGEGDAGAVYVDKAAFVARGTINILHFMKVLF